MMKAKQYSLSVTQESERFFRVDKSRSKQTGGTGLGLAIVKHTAEYLGGSIKLESKEHEGTAVTVVLPKK